MAKKPVEKRTHKKSIEARKSTPGVSTHICVHPERQARRNSAAKRLEEWRSLTIDQQLAEIATRPGKSERQVTRLLALKASGARFVTDTPKQQKANIVEAVTAELEVEKEMKAPPKTDVKATKAWKKKKGKE